MIRIRFLANADDYRPIKWPYPHPFWCSGYGGFNKDWEAGFAIVIAYADNVDQVKEFWPEAQFPEEQSFIQEKEKYEFSGRFPCPEWFKPSVDLKSGTIVE
jgi:hypothetical protein